MRNVFSRRDFLKASAAAVLAASAAGVLTGCDGGGSEIKYNFAGVFVAKIDKTALELTNGKEEISSKLTKTYVPQFRAKASGYGSFKQGVPFKLYVTLQGKTAEFALTSDGKVTVSAVDKV